MLTETPLGGATATLDRKLIGERIQRASRDGISSCRRVTPSTLDLGIEPEVNTPAIELLTDGGMSRVFKLKKMENMSRYKLTKASS